MGEQNFAVSSLAQDLVQCHKIKTKELILRVKDNVYYGEKLSPALKLALVTPGENIKDCSH